MRNVGYITYIIFLYLFVGIHFIGCAHKTYLNDKNMRVMVDDSHLDIYNTQKLQAQLIKTKMFEVVDRGAAWNSLKKEQENQWVDEKYRYEESEKYAHWGKLYGVGAVLAPTFYCIVKQSIWRPGSRIKACTQMLNMVDANTGRIIASENTEGAYDSHEILDWEDIIDKLYDAYSDYNATKETDYTGELKNYRQETVKTVVEKQEE